MCCPEMGGGWNWWVIRMRKSHPSKPKQALHAAAGMDPTSKMIIVVDEDIDPKDPDMELAFTRRYGIATEFVPARGGAIIQRMVSEAKAGKQYFDLHIGGTESVVTGLLPENILEPVEPFLLLPDVKDPKQWWGGHIYIDNAKRFVYNFVAYQTVSLWSNPNEYKQTEFKSFDDLLNPKLYGRIGISDPRTPGSGSSMWSYMPALITVGLVGFISAARDISTVVLLGSGKSRTLSLLMLDFAAGAEFEKATVVAVIIVGLVVAAALFARSLGGQVGIRE